MVSRTPKLACLSLFSVWLWIRSGSVCCVFFVAFDHVNACASMRSLVQIHNICVIIWGLFLNIFYAPKIAKLRYFNSRLILSSWVQQFHYNIDRSRTEEIRQVPLSIPQFRHSNQYQKCWFYFVQVAFSVKKPIDHKL